MNPATLKIVGPAFRRVLNRCTLPLIGKVDDVRQVVCTATPFVIGDRRLLVTAGHAIPTLESLGRLGIPAERGIHYWTPTARLWRRAETSAPYDVGLLEFTSDEGWAPIQARYSPLTLENVYAAQQSHERVLIAGFPYEVTDVLDRESVMNPLLLGTNFYWGAPEEDGADPRVVGHHFLLEYPDALYNAAWEPQTPPSLEGLSGASVWLLTPNEVSEGGIWIPEATGRVIGIQVSEKPRSFLRIVSWGSVARCIATHCPELEGEIEEWYQRGRSRWLGSRSKGEEAEESE